MPKSKFEDPTKIKKDPLKVECSECNTKDLKVFQKNNDVVYICRNCLHAWMELEDE